MQNEFTDLSSIESDHESFLMSNPNEAKQMDNSTMNSPRYKPRVDNPFSNIDGQRDNFPDLDQFMNQLSDALGEGDDNSETGGHTDNSLNDLVNLTKMTGIDETVIDDEKDESAPKTPGQPSRHIFSGFTDDDGHESGNEADLSIGTMAHLHPTDFGVAAIETPNVGPKRKTIFGSALKNAHTPHRNQHRSALLSLTPNVKSGGGFLGIGSGVGIAASSPMPEHIQQRAAAKRKAQAEMASLPSPPRSQREIEMDKLEEAANEDFFRQRPEELSPASHAAIHNGQRPPVLYNAETDTFPEHELQMAHAGGRMMLADRPGVHIQMTRGNPQQESDDEQDDETHDEYNELGSPYRAEHGEEIVRGDRVEGQINDFQAEFDQLSIGGNHKHFDDGFIDSRVQHHPLQDVIEDSHEMLAEESMLSAISEVISDNQSYSYSEDDTPDDDEVIILNTGPNSLRHDESIQPNTSHKIHIFASAKPASTETTDPAEPSNDHVNSYSDSLPSSIQNSVVVSNDSFSAHQPDYNGENQLLIRVSPPSSNNATLNHSQNSNVSSGSSKGHQNVVPINQNLIVDIKSQDVGDAIAISTDPNHVENEQEQRQQQEKQTESDLLSPLSPQTPHFTTHTTIHDVSPVSELSSIASTTPSSSRPATASAVAFAEATLGQTVDSPPMHQANMDTSIRGSPAEEGIENHRYFQDLDHSLLEHSQYTDASNDCTQTPASPDNFPDFDRGQLDRSQLENHSFPAFSPIRADNHSTHNDSSISPVRSPQHEKLLEQSNHTPTQVGQHPCNLSFSSNLADNHDSISPEYRATRQTTAPSQQEDKQAFPPNSARNSGDSPTKSKLPPSAMKKRPSTADAACAPSRNNKHVTFRENLADINLLSNHSYESSVLSSNLSSLTNLTNITDLRSEDDSQHIAAGQVGELIANNSNSEGADPVDTELKQSESSLRTPDTVSPTLSPIVAQETPQYPNDLNVPNHPEEMAQNSNPKRQLDFSDNTVNASQISIVSHIAPDDCNSVIDPQKENRQNGSPVSDNGGKPTQSSVGPDVEHLEHGADQKTKFVPEQPEQERAKSNSKDHTESANTESNQSFEHSKLNLAPGPELPPFQSSSSPLTTAADKSNMVGSASSLVVSNKLEKSKISSNSRSTTFLSTTSQSSSPIFLKYSSIPLKSPSWIPPESQIYFQSSQIHQGDSHILNQFQGHHHSSVSSKNSHITPGPILRETNKELKHDHDKGSPTEPLSLQVTARSIAAAEAADLNRMTMLFEPNIDDTVAGTATGGLAMLSTLPSNTPATRHSAFWHKKYLNRQLRLGTVNLGLTAGQSSMFPVSALDPTCSSKFNIAKRIPAHTSSSSSASASSVRSPQFNELQSGNQVDTPVPVPNGYTQNRHDSAPQNIQVSHSSSEQSTELKSFQASNTNSSLSAAPASVPVTSSTSASTTTSTTTSMTPHGASASSSVDSSLNLSSIHCSDTAEHAEQSTQTPASNRDIKQTTPSSSSLAKSQSQTSSTSDSHAMDDSKERPSVTWATLASAEHSHLRYIQPRHTPLYLMSPLYRNFATSISPSASGASFSTRNSSSSSVSRQSQPVSFVSNASSTSIASRHSKGSPIGRSRPSRVRGISNTSTKIHMSNSSAVSYLSPSTIMSSQQPSVHAGPVVSPFSISSMHNDDSETDPDSYKHANSRKFNVYLPVTVSYRLDWAYNQPNSRSPTVRAVERARAFLSSLPAHPSSTSSPLSSASSTTHVTSPYQFQSLERVRTHLRHSKDGSIIRAKFNLRHGLNTPSKATKMKLAHRNVIHDSYGSTYDQSQASSIASKFTRLAGDLRSSAFI